MISMLTVWGPDGKALVPQLPLPATTQSAFVEQVAKFVAYQQFGRLALPGVTVHCRGDGVVMEAAPSLLAPVVGLVRMAWGVTVDASTITVPGPRQGALAPLAQVLSALAPPLLSSVVGAPLVFGYV